MRTVIQLALLVLLAGCQQETEQSAVLSGAAERSTSAVIASPAIGAWGVDLGNRDLSVRPGDDFYHYANGSWLNTYELPADRVSFGSFMALHEQSQERVRSLLEELTAADPAQGSVAQKVGDYYASFLDLDTVNELGLTPLENELEAIAAIDSRAALISAFGRADLDGSSSPVIAGIEIDRMNPDRWIVGVSVGGLGLPDRDYYLEDSERFADIRTAYTGHIAGMLDLVSYPQSELAAERVMALETAIAELLWPRAERRNRELTYNLMSLEALETAYPDFPWVDFFAANGAVPEEINVRYPSAMAPMLELVGDTGLDTWRAYLTYHLLSNNAFALAETIDDANFDFYGRVLLGQQEQRERWRRGVSLAAGMTGLGFGIGQVYVERYFPPESKAKVRELVNNLQQALRTRIAALEWMSEETKQSAFEKLDAFTANIGYPDEWPDFSEVQIESDQLMSNVRQLRAWQRARAIDRLNRPTDRSEWFMTPQTVNAYYVAQFNSITFPAAILEAPFFDPAADPAVNYGAIGAVIGHEMGHGFDDQGSKSDARGVQRNWWTDADRARFEKRAQKLVAQYSEYEAVPGAFIDGEFTLGENIGDLGGLNMAYHAYRLSLHGEEPPLLDGLTGEQRFFLAYAQVWRAMTRDETQLARLKSDPHSPAEYRVNGVVRNMDAWYRAFDVGPEDAMYLPPEERVSIW